MKKFSFVLLFVFVFCICKSDDGNVLGKVHFQIPTDLPKIIVPAILKDSVRANLIFDTAAKGAIWIDSTFCADHRLNFGTSGINYNTGCAWASDSISTPGVLYQRPETFAIGNIPIKYDGVIKWNYRRYNGERYDGMVHIPLDDSIHLWEINFENGFIQIHPNSTFKAPVGTKFFPMKHLSVTMPISIHFPDKTVLKVRRRCLINIAAHHDISIINNLPEIAILKRQKNGIWICNVNGYECWHTVSATVFNQYKMDSLRLYTYQNLNHCAGLADYILGSNFLKRFNLFFDLKHKRLGLQPISRFHRITDPLVRRYHYSMNEKNIITYMANYTGNYYKRAGLKVGDKILSINGMNLAQITNADMTKLFELGTLKYLVKRKGKVLSIIVQINKNEALGD
ncbi:MAG: hypothetical protein PHU66_01110 [Bacteroidaceae bacterium]|nr:hypothetical protein [Bacteroidaceae bacterium]